MKKVTFSYEFRILFEHPVTLHQFSLRILPVENERQKLEEIFVQISPGSDYAEDTDGFGNHLIFGAIQGEHYEFSVMSSGTVVIETGCYEKALEEYKLGMYKVQSSYTAPDKNMKLYFSEIEKQRQFFGEKKEKGWSKFDRACYYSECIYNYMKYCKGVTTIKTTAKEAFHLGKGVCQDYAHVLLSLCRLADMPARYVTGILEGEGETHAWVEVCCNGEWRGLDPTNHAIVDDHYVKLASGRDYKDCMVSRGVLLGGGTQTLKITAKLKQEEEFEHD